MTDRPYGSVDRERLAAILDAYGADADRWPAEEREGALALIRDDALARSLRERAALLDAVLAAAPDADPPPALVERILAAAPTGPAGAETFRGGRHSRAVRSRASSGARRWRYAATALPLAAAAAVALWVTRPPERVVPALDGLAALGTYETPGDELLTTSEVDLFEDPWVDCSESELGCLDIDSDEGEPRSDAATRGRMRS